MFNSFCNTDIIFCKIDYLREYLKKIDDCSVVIINQSAAERFQLLDTINKSNFICINNFNYNPTQMDIINSLEKISNRKINNIIAIGGGSAIDLGKSIKAFYNTNNINYTIKNITDAIINKNYYHNDINIIAIPTTAGTGSEVTQWATIWDYNNGKKYSIDDKILQPIQALICTELTLTMPKRLILSTALDALSHAMEAFWAKNTNLLSKEISIRAIELIAENLKKSLDDPLNYYCREKLLLASLLAGISFSKTRTTACHSISYPLTSMFKIEHGFAVTLSLSEIYKINASESYDIKEIDNIFSKYNGLKNWLDIVCKDIVKLKLSYFGIKQKDIESIIENAFTSGRMDNNPVNIDKNKLKKILTDIL